MRRVVPLLLVVVTACAAPRRALPVAVPLTSPPGPAQTAARSDFPLSIQRLVTEQRDEMGDVEQLAAPIGDARGRARAHREVSELADELRTVEHILRTKALESDELDAIVARLHALETRIALLHAALRLASGPPSAVQID